MSNTVQRLSTILGAAIGSQQELNLNAQTRLEDVVTSSLQFVVILSEIERNFEITVPEAYLDPSMWGDLGSVAQMIEELSGKGAPVDS
jgi:acyl carrier protein